MRPLPADTSPVLPSTAVSAAAVVAAVAALAAVGKCQDRRPAVVDTTGAGTGMDTGSGT